MYEVHHCSIYSSHWFHIKRVNACKYMYKSLLPISTKRNRRLFDIIMEATEIFLSLIGLSNFNEWDLMFRTPLYMNEDLFYYIIHFSDSGNYIIARLSHTLFFQIDWFRKSPKRIFTLLPPNHHMDSASRRLRVTFILKMGRCYHTMLLCDSFAEIESTLLPFWLNLF